MSVNCPRITLQSGLELSQLVYGMWRLGDDKDRSPAHVQAKIEACVAQGITSIDQADTYGNYESEQLLGAALQAAPKLREQLEIITKCDIKLNNLERIKAMSQACAVKMDRETWFELYVAANGHEVP